MGSRQVSRILIVRFYSYKYLSASKSSALFSLVNFMSKSHHVLLLISIVCVTRLDSTPRLGTIVLDEGSNHSFLHFISWFLLDLVVIICNFCGLCCCHTVIPPGRDQ